MFDNRSFIGGDMRSKPLVTKDALPRRPILDLGTFDDELPVCVAKNVGALVISMETRCTKVAQETTDDN
jgi:hypothetical protein